MPINDKKLSYIKENIITNLFNPDKTYKEETSKLELRLDEKFEKWKARRRRKGTKHSIQDVFKYLTNTPFIHTTKLLNLKGIHKSKRLKNNYDVTSDSKEEIGASFYLDGVFGLDQKVFFSFFRHTMTYQTSNVAILLSPKIANELGYIQMDDIAHYYSDEFENFAKKKGIDVENINNLPGDLHFVDVSSDRNLPYDYTGERNGYDVGSKYLDYLEGLLKKKRMSVIEFFKLTSYIALRKLANNEHMDMTQAIHNSIPSGVELHINKRLNFGDISGIIVDEEASEQSSARKLIDKISLKKQVFKATDELRNIHPDEYRSYLDRMKSGSSSGLITPEDEDSGISNDYYNFDESLIEKRLDNAPTATRRINKLPKTSGKITLKQQVALAYKEIKLEKDIKDKGGVFDFIMRLAKNGEANKLFAYKSHSSKIDEPIGKNINVFSLSQVVPDDIYKILKQIIYIEKEKKRKNFKFSLSSMSSKAELFKAYKDISNIKHTKYKKEYGVKHKHQIGSWMIVVPSSTNCSYAKDANWCTVGNSDNAKEMFQYYTKEGNLYILYNKRNGKRYQLQINEQEIRDDDDMEINWPEYKKIPVEVMHWCYDRDVADGFKPLGKKHERGIVTFMERPVSGWPTELEDTIERCFLKFVGHEVDCEGIIKEGLTESPYDSPNKEHLKKLRDEKFLKGMRHEILARLFNNLKKLFHEDKVFCKYLDTCLKNYSKSVKIIGGFLTRFAKADSDIDVNVILKNDILKKIKGNKEESLAKVHEYFRDNVNDKPLSMKHRYVVNYFFLDNNTELKSHGVQLLSNELDTEEIVDKLDDKMVDVTTFLSLEKFEQYIFSPMKKAIKILEDMVERKEWDRISELKKVYSITERVGGEIFKEFEDFSSELTIYNYTADNLRFKAMNEDSDFHDIMILLEHEKLDKLEKRVKNAGWDFDFDFKESICPQIRQKLIDRFKKKKDKEELNALLNEAKRIALEEEVILEAQKWTRMEFSSSVEKTKTIDAIDDAFKKHYDPNYKRDYMPIKALVYQITTKDPLADATSVSHFSNIAFNILKTRFYAGQAPKKMYEYEKETSEEKRNEIEFDIITGLNGFITWAEDDFSKILNKEFDRIRRNKSFFEGFNTAVKTVPEFQREADRLALEKEKQIKKKTKKVEHKSEIERNTIRVYEDKDWEVVVPQTIEASNHHGKGTKWCTTSMGGDEQWTTRDEFPGSDEEFVQYCIDDVFLMDFWEDEDMDIEDKAERYDEAVREQNTENIDDNMFDHHNSQGHLYVIKDKHNTDSHGRQVKYQLHFETGQFKDMEDEDIELEEMPKKALKAIIKHYNEYDNTNDGDELRLEYIDDGKNDGVKKTRINDNAGLKSSVGVTTYLNNDIHSFDDKPGIARYKKLSFDYETLEGDDFYAKHWYSKGKPYRENTKVGDEKRPTAIVRDDDYAPFMEWYVDGRKKLKRTYFDREFKDVRQETISDSKIIRRINYKNGNISEIYLSIDGTKVRLTYYDNGDIQDVIGLSLHGNIEDDLDFIDKHSELDKEDFINVKNKSFKDFEKYITA